MHVSSSQPSDAVQVGQASTWHMHLAGDGSCLFHLSVNGSDSSIQMHSVSQGLQAIFFGGPTCKQSTSGLHEDVLAIVAFWKHEGNAGLLASVTHDAR